MEKENAIKYLRSMDCEIADVTVMINGSPKSILVYLVTVPSNEDLVKPCNHWWICTDVDEFDYYFEPEMVIVFINEFVSDYNKK